MMGMVDHWCPIHKIGYGGHFKNSIDEVKCPKCEKEEEEKAKVRK